MQVLIQRTSEGITAGIEIPRYANPGDAGADLQTVEEFTLEPGERRLISTGVKIALEDGFAGFIHPRSGLAAKSGITIVNAPGTIDAGYRGEIKVCLLNTDSSESKNFKAGDRIAQLIVQRVEKAEFAEVKELPGAARGEQGFGSSGS